MSQSKLYVLELNRNKFYIGRSQYEDLRLIQHTLGKGAAWTSKYSPIGILEIRPCKSPFEEDMLTKEYMAKYGIDNVRGGSYVKVVLDSIQIDAITRELVSVSDACKYCGNYGHFINECSEKKVVEVTIQNRIWLCEYCDMPFTSRVTCVSHEGECPKQILRSTLQV